MIISGRTTFAIRCPQCGKLELTSVSRFALGGGRSHKITCSCGSEKLTLGSRHGKVWLQIPCYLCEGVHFAYHAPKHFWSGDMKPVMCAETDLQLGVFGDENDVEIYARTGGSELDRLMEDEAFGEYFDHPEVMYEALSRVHHLAEEGNLTCVCGNRHISVDIYPERLELSCPGCGRRRTVRASSDEDLRALEQTRRIEVGGAGGAGDDAAGRRKGNKK